ncbi:chemotaxis protein MotB [Thermosediminibacter litoriperuensis]|uniref:Chemotaxis protein MotB n=1 Tax=Thermosediminibacter litoriperuensis TaxID=291989 RepID=A0A5S5AYY1_9FIRM|nr:OmpA family protein [Thermosediminibacter litoriperuensis]TYP59921.1 chemotaxis protein MotB [Thermosediminibacter litoriperuensis]
MPGVRRRNGGGNDSPPGAPLWMTTYGDLITQILIFFVLLFALSNIDAKKFDMAMTSLQGSLGILDGGRTLTKKSFIEGGLVGENLPEGREERELRNLENTILEIIEENNFKGIRVGMDERGLAIRFMEGALFDSGKAYLREDARQVLDKIAPILRQSRRPIRVEGHTDNVPIHTREFPSNWELSTTRAVNVVRYFIEKHNISPRIISAAGYGEYHPIAPNDSEKNRALNRRVDIIILNSSSGSQEPR